MSVPWCVLKVTSTTFKGVACVSVLRCTNLNAPPLLGAVKTVSMATRSTNMAALDVAVISAHLSYVRRNVPTDMYIMIMGVNSASAKVRDVPTDMCIMINWAKLLSVKII